MTINHCPICNYEGNFQTFLDKPQDQCPKCRSYERQRATYLIFHTILEEITLDKMLHVSPEICNIGGYFQGVFDNYETGDLLRNDVDHKFDLTDAPFENESYDFIVCSHVLEHIFEDLKAISEIYRLLKINGIAILIVPNKPIEKTVEYGYADPKDWHHVRKCGLDYSDRYEKYFSKVRLFTAQDNNEPIENQELNGFTEHTDIIAVCYK